jgi:hypothetical protein
MTTLAMCAAAGLLACLGPQELAPRFVTTFPNGAKSVRLLLSSRGLGDDHRAQQLRHLLEHFMVKGPSDQFAPEAEAKGLFLVGRTFRDAVSFEVRYGKGNLVQAVEVLDGVLREPRIDDAAVEGELRVLAEESAIDDDPARFSSALWGAAYPPSANGQEIPAPSIEELRTLARRLTAANRMTLAIAGPVSLGEATKAAESFLGDRSGGDSMDGRSRGMGAAGEAKVPMGRGAARAVPVGPYSSRDAAATLAAALAIASELKHGYVIYTPSILPGLVIVGDEGASPALAAAVESAAGANAEALYARGKDLARRWVERFLADPSGVTFLRGLLLSQSAGASPELLKEAVASMSLADFRLGCARFRVGSCVSALGGR